MSGIDDVQLDPHAHDPGDGGPERQRSPLRAVLLVALLVAAGVAGYLLVERYRTPASPPRPTAPAAGPQEVAAKPEPASEALLPPLDASDAVVRELVRTVSANPDLVVRLVTDGLIRCAAAAVDNVAEGVSPAQHFPSAAPARSFSVDGSDADPVIAPASFHRYDALAAAVASLDAAGVARLYRRLEPLFDQAYQDLGYPGRRFRDTLAKAIRSLLAVPVPPARIEVVAGTRSYRFRDPDLEGLTAAQKLLVRMGPDNVRRIQAKLREIGGELGV